MSKVIRIDDEVYEGLKKLAKPFDDTPNSVIRRLLEQKAVLPMHNTTPSPLSATPVVAATARRRRRIGRTQNAAFRLPILRALVKNGGRGRVNSVLNVVWQEMRDQLTQADHQSIPSGEPRWRNTARWERKNMVQDGLLGGARGEWEITQKGRAFLASHAP